MKRTKSLRRVSLKRAKLDRKVKPERYKLVVAIGKCEVCRTDKLYTLCGHEIVRCGLRAHVYNLRPLILVVCDSCHKKLEKESWSKEKQLAYLYISRPLDFQLSVVNRWATGTVYREDVMIEVKKIETLLRR